MGKPNIGEENFEARVGKTFNSAPKFFEKEFCLEKMEKKKGFLPYARGTIETDNSFEEFLFTIISWLPNQYSGREEETTNSLSAIELFTKTKSKTNSSPTIPELERF